jgi:putative nucleotidyltransferase with HDIG domain
MAIRSEVELIQEVEHLRAELLRHEREASEKELQLERYAADLRETFKQERARSQELRRSYMATVRALSNAVEARDAYTGKHAERVAAYAIEIARALGVPISDAPEIEFGFLLHDIGKLAIPDAILYKPGTLTECERALMAQHPLIGAEIVREIAFLDALTTERPYRPASPLSVAREMIVAESGQQFDPQVVEAFKSIDDETLQRVGAEVR